jgi:peptidoglycan/LPS O-acetylase OafA/YrhL
MTPNDLTRRDTISSVHLNAIRGAAALVVLLGHTRNLFFSSLTGSTNSAIGRLITSGSVGHSPAYDPSQVTIGNEAVIIFFVLSGYLVGGSAIRDVTRGRWSWKRYLFQRSTRLWIVLLPALLFGTAIDSIGLRMFAGEHSIYACPAGQTLVPCNLAARVEPKVVAANAFFLQTILVETAGSNNALWSLANEFWYYLAFPMVLLAAQAGQPKSRRVFYLVLLLLTGVVAGKSIVSLFFVWLLGALISILPLRIPRKTLNLAAGSLALLLPLSMVFIRRAHIPRYLAEWMVAILFSIALYLVLHRREPAKPGIYMSLAGFFSRISYTMYLVHLPLAVLLCAFINTPWHPWDRSMPHLLLFLLLNGVLVSLSYLFYLAFEANTDSIRHLIFRRLMFGSQSSYPLHLQVENLPSRVVPEIDASTG